MSSAWALIEHEQKVLFVQRSFDRGRGGQWCLPGGTMWRGEAPDVACVREAFEETGLRVTVVRPLAVFRDAHYFLCKLQDDIEQTLSLRQEECIDASWIQTPDILTLGTVMDLRRMIPLFQMLDFPLPNLPHYLKFAVPDQSF